MSYQKVVEYIPEKSEDYVLYLLNKYKPILKIAGARKTKLGDFKPSIYKGNHTVSVNGTLPKHNFLITLIHEIAHSVCWDQYGRSIKPHGVEWKITFKELMLPVLSEEVFPDDILRALAKHLKNPKSSVVYDVALKEALDKQNGINETYLNSLYPEDVFEFGSNKYKVISKRRTRFLCEEIYTKKRYTISGLAAVKLVENSSKI